MAQHGGMELVCLAWCVVFVACQVHECDRLCLDQEPPKKCFYHFTVGLSRRKHDSNSPQTIFASINGQQPGPLISVCQNDIIVVDVKNQLPFGIETSLHWHGFAEGNSPFMDGVPMVTQCPIFPHTSFRYHLKATKPGTFYYRAHSVAQQLDGIYGPLIVHSVKDQSNPSRTIVISPKLGKLQMLEDSFETDLNVTELQLDVYNTHAPKKEDKTAQRLRIINAGALDCPIQLFTHTVPLKVIAVDGNNVKPIAMNEIIINPGERVDLLVKSEIMKKTHIMGKNLCKGHSKYGFDAGTSEKNDLTGKDGLDPNEVIHKLESEMTEKLRKSDVNVYIPFDASVFEDFNGTVDFRYKLGAVTTNPPSYLSKNSVPIYQVHNMSFMYPPSPILSQSSSISDDLICSLDEPSSKCTLEESGFCECLQIINLPYNKNVDLFLINEGNNSNASQTIHIHGHSFYVLLIKSFNTPIKGSDILEKGERGEITKNLNNPVKKDTVVVPNKGYVVLRIKTGNPGKWLIESTTSKARLGSGFEVVLNVENPLQDQVPPENFPTCGSKKDPDQVFNND